MDADEARDEGLTLAKLDHYRDEWIERRVENAKSFSAAIDAANEREKASKPITQTNACAHGQCTEYRICDDCLGRSKLGDNA